jgi:hypothetical protein
MNRKLLFLILVGAAFVSTANAVLTTNSWSDNSRGSFKWETASEWSLHVPTSTAQSCVLITNNISGFGIPPRIVTIDATTVLSNAINGCMIISNLTMSIPSAINRTELFLNNTGDSPLYVLGAMSISNQCILLITNSILSFPETDLAPYPLGVDGTVLLESGTIDADGSGSYSEVVGINSSGTLTVAGGLDELTAGSGMLIGFNPGSTGTVWVTGGNLDVGGDTVIGYSGVGSLIQSNGIVSAAGEFSGVVSGGQGLLAIAGGTNIIGSVGLVVGYSVEGGIGTVWLTGGTLLVTNQAGIYIFTGSITQSNGVLDTFSESVGGTAVYEAAGEGTLTMAGGTHVVGLGGLNVPDFAGSTGTVWVTGGHLLATSFSNIIGGYGAVGSLVQSNGDVDMVFSEYVGNDAGSEGTLTVAGGTHTVEGGELTIGNNATAMGTVWVTGGQLETDSAVIGVAGVGQMSVSNGNWQVEDVSVGAASGGQGTLTVAGGMSVVSSDLTIGTPDCTGTGTVTVTGGSLFVTNATHNAVLDLENSTLTLSGGTLVADIFVKTNPCAVFQQTGGRLVVGGVTNIVVPPLFSITAISREGNDMRISWQTGGGVTNAVQATNGGPGGSYNTNFNDLASFIFGPSGEITNTYVDPGGATNIPSRFYRVRLVP